MRECVYCLGEGVHDMRDVDALIAEHADDESLAIAKATSVGWMSVIPCDQCDGTGLMGDDEHADHMAFARASLDQAIAKLKARGEW